MFKIDFTYGMASDEPKEGFIIWHAKLPKITQKNNKDCFDMNTCRSMFFETLNLIDVSKLKKKIKS